MYEHIHIIIVSCDYKIYPTRQEAYIETYTNFSCESDGEVEWIFSKSDSPKKGVKIGNDQLLIINTVSIKNGGYYFCYGYDKKIKQHFLARAILKVYGKLVLCIFQLQCYTSLNNTNKSDSAKVYPRERYAIEGETTTIMCKTDGKARWSFEKGNMPHNVIMKPNNILEIIDVKIDNEGYYECEAFNEMGTYYAKAYLLVISE